MFQIDQRFRAKTKYDHWVYGNLDVDGFKNVFIRAYKREGNGQLSDVYEVIPETVGLITWVLDTNDVYSFVGDILQFKGNEMVTFAGYGKVTYNKGQIFVVK